MQSMAKLRLLIVERGADLPALSPTDPIGDLVIVPDGSDLPMDLALRVVQRIARAERRGQHVEEATIAIANDGRRQRSAARALIARALVRHQLHAGGGEILLWARCSPTSDTRHEILALAGVLMSELGSTRVSLRVLFDPYPEAFADVDQELTSGVHAIYEAGERPSWSVSGGGVS
jgi:hypothetical protein